MDFITNATAWLNSFSNGGIAASLAVLVEIALRAIPSPKPLSLVIAAEGIFTGLGQFMTATANALDKIVPQNTKS